MGNKTRIKPPLLRNRMAFHLQLQHRASLLFLILLLCSFTKLSQSASVESTIRNTNNNHHNVQFRNRMERRATYPHEQQYQPTYSPDQHNKYDSRVGILEDDTLRLSLSIDNDGGLSAPSLHLIEPKVYHRVPGESGMIRPDNSYRDKNNEVLSASAPSPNVVNNHEIEEEEVTEDDDMNDNYHHHFPYIESYREKYTKPELNHVAPTKQIPVAPKSKKIWSEIIAQFIFRRRFGNVADLDDEHSKYFVKTRPRSVTTSGSNIYSNFYYEPPSSHHLDIDYHEDGEVSHNDYNHDDHELPHQDTTVTTQILHQTLDVSTSQSIVPKFTLNLVSALKLILTLKLGLPSNGEKTSGITTEAPITTTDATGIPGTPGVDYPVMHNIPQTGFDAWHYCDFTDGHSTFLCPNGTLFSQVLLTCDWWFNVDCDQARQLYVLNERLYRYIKPPNRAFRRISRGACGQLVDTAVADGTVTQS
ncbi:hypothetical protein Ocin01_18319 [Orchesella cincta]|uniref:Chitin-binding type-2 domain-containing protein n=1 Tax=Orchesella cincta TaxID=48709 RepID=A0A1D2M5X2_ORCCI|nr:hypothetical protein Ocin01_18319 [Orchesella cincta]